MYVFHDEESNDFKDTDLVEHVILLETRLPSHGPIIRPFVLREEMSSQVENMLCIIREICSPCLSRTKEDL